MPVGIPEMAVSDQEADSQGSRNGCNVLTGILDQRAFLAAVEQVCGRCRLSGEPLSILLLDLDRFREINSSHSHSVGDRVLSWVADELQKHCRPGDVVCRYGWDGFAAALPGAGEIEARQLAQELGRSLAARTEPFGTSRVSIAVSFGVAGLGAGFVGGTRELIQRAEGALAVAKEHGGNQAVAFSAISDGACSQRRLGRAGLTDVGRWVGNLRAQLRQAYLDSTRTLVAAVEAKDPYTRSHSIRVCDNAVELGCRLGLSAGQIETLRSAAMLHDVGKIGVPDAVLRKPGPLTRDESVMIRLHPQTAVQILGHASFLNAELPIILHHHERYDGHGYPDGLSGERIPFPARILAVADALDAMSSRRSYKVAYDRGRIRRELEQCAGRQWDPVVVEAALQWLDEDSHALDAASDDPEERAVREQMTLRWSGGN